MEHVSAAASESTHNTERSNEPDQLDAEWAALQEESRDIIIQCGWTPAAPRTGEAHAMEAFIKSGRRKFRPVPGIAASAAPAERVWDFRTAPRIVLEREGWTYNGVFRNLEVFKNTQNQLRTRPIPAASARILRAQAQRERPAPRTAKSRS